MLICYNGIMEIPETEKNPLDIEELIRQAREVLKRWKKPDHERRHSLKTMQEIMDDRPFTGGEKAGV